MKPNYPFLNLYDTNRQYRDALVAAATRVIDSGRYIGGPEVDEVETLIASICGASHAVALSNGLDALRLTLRAYVQLGKLAPGHEVLVPANTYIASILAIIDAGLTPVLVDVDPQTSLIDANDMNRAISGRTRALMTVHLYGRVAWSDAIRDIVSQHGLIVLEDNAQAIGAVSATPGINGGVRSGSLGHAGAISFYPTKNVGALGDAGAVTTDDSELATTVRALANYGADRRYHNIYAGFNCRMDSLQAALLAVKLRHLDAENDLRAERARIYSDTIDNRLITLPPKPVIGRECVWHQYVISTPLRDKLQCYLADNGVGTDIHYAVPPHMQPCLSALPHRPVPVTERLSSTILSLPIGNSTSLDDAKEIASIINQFNP